MAFFCSTINGYDGSLLNSLLQSKDFLAKFNGTNDGIWAGIVTSMYQIGSVVALPFIGPAVDGYGRRAGMFIGCFLVVAGTVILGTASFNDFSVGQFMGGRFLVGFGVAICTSAGPIYVVEVAHPAYRSVLGGFYNTWWFTGSILAAGVTRGTENLRGSASWEVTIWFQLAFPVLVCIFAFMLPESPRWLYVNGKMDRAKTMLARFHGEGNPDSIWVSMQLAEYEEYLEMNGADKRWWDYRALFKSRSSCYRLFCNCIVQMMGQEAGNCKSPAQYISIITLTFISQLFSHIFKPPPSPQPDSLTRTNNTTSPLETPASNSFLQSWVALSLTVLVVVLSSCSPILDAALSGWPCALLVEFSPIPARPTVVPEQQLLPSNSSSALYTVLASLLFRLSTLSKFYPTKCVPRVWPLAPCS